MSERARLRVLRESLSSRRRTLSTVKLQSPRPLSQSSGDIAREVQELTSLSATIARARSGLVQELVEVFNVVEVGGRPPIGGKAGTKGEWTIGDLILPVPGDIRRESILFHQLFLFATSYLEFMVPFYPHLTSPHFIPFTTCAISSWFLRWP